MKNITNEEEWAIFEWHVTKLMLMMPLIVLSYPFRWLYWKFKEG